MSGIGPKAKLLSNALYLTMNEMNERFPLDSDTIVSALTSCLLSVIANWFDDPIAHWQKVSKGVLDKLVEIRQEEIRQEKY